MLYAPFWGRTVAPFWGRRVTLRLPQLGQRQQLSGQTRKKARRGYPCRAVVRFLLERVDNSARVGLVNVRRRTRRRMSATMAGSMPSARHRAKISASWASVAVTTAVSGATPEGQSVDAAVATTDGVALVLA